MSFPLNTLAALLSPAGITSPSYDDILTSLKTSAQLIYGSDIYLGADTMDGQLLAIVAQAIYDANQTAIAVYNQFSPVTAQGAGLSSIVKTNGIRRLIPTNSQVDLLIGGTVGTVINNGSVTDPSGNTWVLPSVVTIPGGGSILVGALCKAKGAIVAAANTINTIATPTFGWSTVTNPNAASVGQLVETDAALRSRQTLAVALPALTVLESTVAALKGIPGVISVTPYENATNTTDANGLPAHSVSFVVLGGDATAIATVIARRKTPGTATYGTSTVNVVDQVGITHPINFFIPGTVRVAVAVTVKALTGWTTAIGVQLRQAIVDYINAIGVGQNVMIKRLDLPAQLFGAMPNSGTYELTILTDGVYPTNNGTADLTIAFNVVAQCQLGDVTLTVI